MHRSLQFAARRLIRARAFTITGVLALALGVGAAAAVFTVVNGVLLRPLPYREPEQLVDLSHTTALAGVSRIDESDATYLLYRRSNRVFTDVGAYRAQAVNLAAAPGSSAGVATERAAAAIASASVFRVLGVPPRRGRGFVESDDDPGAPPVAMIGQGLWERAFGADSAIIGRQIAVDGVEREVVGIMPGGFRFPTPETAVWLPLQIDPAHMATAAFDYHAIARLRAGVTASAAAADLQRLLPRVPEEYPGRFTAASIDAIQMRESVRPLRDVIVGDVGRALWIVLGAVCVLLLIACANVANLFLARAEGRQREIGVRRALGAGRSAILIDALSEALIVSGVGGVLGLGVALVGVRSAQAMGAATSIPRLNEVYVDPTVLVAMAATVALIALVIGMVPARHSRVVSLSAILMSSGQGATGGRARKPARRALVIAQVALALVLLVGAALLARSFARLRSVNPGFVADDAITFRLALPRAAYPRPQDAARGILGILNAAGAIPGAQGAGVTTNLPLEQGTRSDSAVFIQDHPLKAGTVPPIREIVFATPSYFAAMRIPLTAGRAFVTPREDGEPGPGTLEVIVSESFARRFWTPATAVGKQIRLNRSDPWSTIVGVAGDVHDAGLDQPPGEIVYRPLATQNAAGAPWAPREVAVVVRSVGNAAPLAAALRRAVATQDPALPVYRLMPLGTLLRQAEARMTFVLLMLGGAAALAIAIGAVGIYGVVAYLVSLRTREIGVRVALGARPADVRRLVARQTLGDALLGVGIGLFGAMLATRALATVLFEVSPLDPAALAGASALLLTAALVASWVPARRAAALDPVIALRSD